MPWGPPISGPDMPDMKALLDRASVQDLIQVLGEDRVRLVGGCVRDTLAGLDIKDIDACTPFLPQEVAAKFESSGFFSAHPTGLAHGTLTAHHLETRESLEVTTLRRDVATDGRRATVAFTQDWQEDAARRDFTFNALMLDPAGKVHDYFEGQSDLRAGHVRFIGEPLDRLREDWLRALRYFRFWGRFGRALPTAQEAAALQVATQNLGHLSVERIWVELKGLVQASKAREALRLFEQLGFAKALGLDVEEVPFKGLDPVAAWAGLLGPGNEGFLAHMKASKDEQNHFAAVRASLRSSETRFARQVRFGHGATRAAEHLKGRGTDFPPAHEFPVAAAHLMDRGFEPGPALGAKLLELKEIWIKSEGQASEADLLDALTKSTT